MDSDAVWGFQWKLVDSYINASVRFQVTATKDVVGSQTEENTGYLGAITAQENF